MKTLYSQLKSKLQVLPKGLLLWSFYLFVLICFINTQSIGQAQTPCMYEEVAGNLLPGNRTPLCCTNPSGNQIIPVVFHNFEHDNMTAGFPTNSEIESLVTFTNLRLSPYFTLVIVPSENDCYDLVNRIEGNNRTLFINDELTFKNMGRRDPSQYMNVWMVKDIENGINGRKTTGYAYNPLRDGWRTEIDGVVIDHSIISGGDRTTFAHEIGHYLGLDHVWGSEADLFSERCDATCNGGDFVEDTEPCTNSFLNINNDYYNPSDCSVTQELIDAYLELINSNPAYTIENHYAFCSEVAPFNYPCHNLMSYTSERDEFTPGQFCRMIDVYNMHRGGLEHAYDLCNCPTVFPDIVATNVEDTEVTLDFSMVNPPSSYHIKYKALGQNGLWTDISDIQIEEIPITISNLQPGTTYRFEVSFEDNSCNSEREIEVLTTCNNSGNCLPCTQDQILTLDQDQLLVLSEFKGEIRIVDGATVRIRSDVVFGADSKIFVDADSRLILEDANLSACEGELWEGINLWSPIVALSSQPAILEMKNSTISDAKVGIDASFVINNPLFGNNAMGGGKVGAVNCTIQNCQTGIRYGRWSSPFFGQVQTSTFEGCTISNCVFGVNLGNNNGVLFEDCNFVNNQKTDIESNASGFTLSRSLISTGIYVSSTSPSIYAPVITNNDFNGAQLYLEHGTSLSTTEIISNRFFCSSQGDGIVMFGENAAIVTGNDFYDCFTGMYYENTGDNISDNLISENLFDNDYYASTAVDLNDFEYQRNCFASTAKYDIELVGNAKIHEGHGDPSLSAGNCFSDFSQINGRAILGSPQSQEFTYFSKDAFENFENCKNPKEALYDEYKIEESEIEVLEICGTESFPGNILNRYRYCTYTRGDLEDRQNMLDALIEEIERIKNDDSIEPWFKKWLIAKYRRCIDSHLKKSAKTWIENDSTETAIEFLSSHPEFRYKSLAYGVILSTLDFDRASDFLNSLVPETASENDFINSQSIYLDYLKNVGTYETSRKDEETLMVAGLKSNTLSYASRGIFKVLTGSKILLPFRHLDGDDIRTEIITENNVDVSDVSIYPNPLRNENLTVEFQLSKSGKFTLFNTKGELLAKTSFDGKVVEIEVPKTAKGILLLKIMMSDGTFSTKKIIKI